MAKHPQRTIERLREQLRTGERGRDDADRDLLLAFSDRLRLLRTEYSDQRHAKLLRHCVRMSEEPETGLVPALEDGRHSLVRHNDRVTAVVSNRAV